MKTYSILIRIRGSFKILDKFWSTETEKTELEQLNKEMLIGRIREKAESLHLITKKYGEVSDIVFSEMEKYRDPVSFADKYYLNGHYTVRTNKLLSVSDVIVENYFFIKKWGIKAFRLTCLIEDVINVLSTNFEEMERLSLLQIEEETK